MNSLRVFTKLTAPVVAFGVGFFAFPANWRKGNWQPRRLTYMNESVLGEIESSPLYKSLDSDSSVVKQRSSETFPTQHRNNYIGTGLLFGPQLFEVDPIIFTKPATGELTAFYHLGKQLVSADGEIHNGVTATILDEGLCACGFAKLPSKRGVTAKLSIDFKNQAPPDSTVVLRAKIAEMKGRKVVINGTLSTFPRSGKPEMDIASASCVLVEPKWFRYLRWLEV